MQNIDYSRRLRTREIPSPRPVSQQQVFSISGNSFQRSQKSPSFLFIMAGAILLFTSGLVIGLKIDQKETAFAQNELKESQSFKNISPKEEKAQDAVEKNESKDLESPKKQIKSNKKKEISLPKTLKFPPKSGESNFMIQLGSYPPENSISIGKKLIKAKPELQGRLFRTTSGKLYLGYFYSEEDAKNVLSKIKTLQNGVFRSASIKTLEY